MSEPKQSDWMTARGAGPEYPGATDERVFTLKQLEPVLGLKRVQLMRLIAAGELRSEKHLTHVGGAAHFVRQSELERFLQARQQEVAAADRERRPGRRPRITAHSPALTWTVPEAAAPAVGSWLARALALQGFRWEPSGAVRSPTATEREGTGSLDHFWLLVESQQSTADQELLHEHLNAGITLRAEGCDLRVALPAEDAVSFGLVGRVPAPQCLRLFKAGRLIRQWSLAAGQVVRLTSLEVEELRGVDRVCLESLQPGAEPKE